MEFLVIFSLIIVQSIFGIGLLLFGTPTFILLDYSFAETLSILLPISMTISSLQIIFSRQKNKKFIRDFNIYCIPFLIISIYLILNFDDHINFNLFISLIILMVLVINLFKNLIKFNSISTKIFLIIIGVVHGLSNLGGSLLSFLAVQLNKNDKILSRFFISYGYFMMAFFQYLVLTILKENNLNINYIFYIFLAIAIYFPIQKLFKKIKNRNFNNLIYFFAFIYALYIFLRSFY